MRKDGKVTNFKQQKKRLILLYKLYLDCIDLGTAIVSSKLDPRFWLYEY